MSKLKAHIKALAPYWSARREHARRKFRQAIGAIGAASLQTELPAGQRPTVLVFSSMGIFADHMVVDTLLARELQRQGAQVIVVLCDAALPICHVADRYAYAFALGEGGRRRRQQRMCSDCTAATTELQRDSGLTYARFSEGIAHSRAQSGSVADIDISDEIKSGVIRFTASSHDSVLRRLPPDVPASYERAAQLAQQAISGLCDKFQPNLVIAHHGIYLPQGVVQKVARQRGASFYSWHFGYRKSTLIFSRGDTYHRELTAAQPAAFERPLNERQHEQITRYLQSRISGGQDWIHFNRTPRPFDTKGAPRGYFVCYTSVDWDAALHFPASVFSSQFDFIDKLVDIFRDVNDIDLIIRVHPAEITGFHPAALSAEAFLRQRSLPSNVRVIGAKDTTSSYDLAQGCVAAIVYNTKLGIELPTIGIPVIVAGDCWIRDKGFSYDVNELDDLKRYIDAGNSLTVTPDQRERALQFAHYFYYRRCIDTPELTSAGTKFQVAVNAEEVRKSQHDGRGMAFIAERLLAAEHVMTAA